MAARPTVGLCIPTLDPGRWVDAMVAALAAQEPQPDRILVIDSASTDGTVERFAAVGAEIERIEREEFDHGGTRNLGRQLLGTDVVVYLTQDAVPAGPRAVGALVDGLLADDAIALAYGRQLPHPEAGALARVHRAFNYPPEAARRTSADVADLGVKAAFASDAFSAYRSSALDDIGGFPAPVIGSEDRWAAARLLQAGYAVAYVSGAEVVHSHDYDLGQQFRRYFDIGVFHTTERWFDEYLGRPDAEGRRLVQAQVSALRAEGVSFPAVRAVAHAGAAWLGWQAGRRHRRVPHRLARRWSTAPSYFDRSRRFG